MSSLKLNPLTGLAGKVKSKELRPHSDYTTPKKITDRDPSYHLPNVGVSESQYNTLLPSFAYDNPALLEATRAANQPWHHELGNAMARLGAEVGGGTLESIGILGEVGSALMDSDKNFIEAVQAGITAENSLISAGKSIKDYVNEQMPIYNAAPGGSMLGSSENFFEGIVSLGSTLSMLIPTIGAMKLLTLPFKTLKYVSRGTKIAHFLRTSDRFKQRFQGISMATLSREIESTLEARETYESLLHKGVSKEESLKQAKKVYTKNWAMLIQDIPQYLFVGKMFNKKTGSFTKNSKRKLAGAYAAQMAGEAGEEAYQYLVSKGAEADGLFNDKKGDFKSMGDVLGESSTDPQFWNSAMMGALGGGIFKAAFEGTQNLANRKQIKEWEGLKSQYVNERGKRTASLLKQVQHFEEIGEPEKALIAQRQWNYEKSLEAAQMGDDIFASHIEHLEGLQNLDQSELESLKEQGVEMDSDKLQSVAKDLIESSLEVKENYDKYLNKFGDKRLAIDLTTNRYNAKNFETLIDKQNKKLQELENKLPSVKNLSEHGTKSLKIKSKIAAIKNHLKELDNIEKASEDDSTLSEVFKDVKEEKNLEIEELNNELSELGIADTRSNAEKSKDSKISKRIEKNQVEYGEYLKTLEGLEYSKMRSEQFELEYNNLFNKTYKGEKNFKTLVNKLNQLGNTSITDLNELEEEYEKDGLLGDSKLKEQFEKKRASIEQAVKIRLKELVKKVHVDKKQLSTDEIQFVNSNIDQYAEMEAQTVSDLKRNDPATATDINSEPSSENEENTQPENEELFAVTSGFLHPMIIAKYKNQNKGLFDYLESTVDKTNHSAIFELNKEKGDISFVIFNKDGSPFLQNGNQVEGFLYKANGKGITASYSNQINVLTSRLKGGFRIKLKIRSQINLQLSKPEVGSVAENNIESVFGKMEPSSLFYTNANGEYVSVQTGETVSFGNSYLATKKQKGLIFTAVTNINGKTPVKLNTQRIDEDTANFLADVYEEMLENGDENNFISKTLQDRFTGVVDEMTFKNVINSLIYGNTKTKGHSQTLYFYNNAIVFGENNDKFTKASFDKSIFKTFLKEHKRFNINIKLLQNKTKGQAYLDSLIDSKRLSTDKEKGEIFETPGTSKGGGYIYFDMAIPKENNNAKNTNKEFEDLDEALAANDVLADLFEDEAVLDEAPAVVAPASNSEVNNNNKTKKDELDFVNSLPVGKQITLQELEKLGLLNNSLFGQKLYDAILKTAGQFNIKILFTNGVKELDNRAGGSFSSETGVVLINLHAIYKSFQNSLESKGRAGGTLLGTKALTDFQSFTQYIITHELIHGITQSAYNNVYLNTRKGKYKGDLNIVQVEAIQKIGQIFNYLKSLDSDIYFGGKEYGLVNMSELMAEMSNEGFVSALERIELPENLRYSAKNKNIFKSIISFITDLFTGKKLNNNAADSLFAAISDIVTTPQIQNFTEGTFTEDNTETVQDKINETKQEKQASVDPNASLNDLFEEDQEVIGVEVVENKEERVKTEKMEEDTNKSKGDPHANTEAVVTWDNTEEDLDSDFDDLVDEEANDEFNQEEDDLNDNKFCPPNKK